MSTIEISTSQNVKIEYQLAGLALRLFAYLIDLAVIVVSIIVYTKIFSNANINEINVSIIFLMLYLIFYSLLSEVIGNGQSIGKLAMGIKVIKINGDELEFYDYFGRWTLRFIDIYFSLGIIASIMVISNKNGQRLGDLIGGTTVIKKRSTFGFKLNDILKLNQKDRDSYEFEYPLARKLEEKDVLLIKNLIYRKHIYHNLSHHEAYEALVKRIAEVVEVSQIPSDKEAFLNKVMTEYIILTR